MKLTFWLLVSCLSVWTVSGEVDYNSLVDKVIDELKQRLIKENKTEILLPEIEKSFTEKILFIPVPGSLTISGSKLGDLSTLRRFGNVDATVSSDKVDLSITSTFSLDQLTIGIANFLSSSGITVKLGFLHTMWDYVNFGDNTFTVMVKMHLDKANGQCSIHLGFARIDRLGDIQVVERDQGFFTPSVEHMDDIILDWFAPEIENAINTYVNPIALQVIQDLSSEICSTFL